MSGDRGWAVRIESRVADGASVPRYAVDMAAQVLGRPLLRGGKHTQRPDAKDRQAGDFDCSEMVPL